MVFKIVVSIGPEGLPSLCEGLETGDVDFGMAVEGVDGALNVGKMVLCIVVSNDGEVCGTVLEGIVAVGGNAGLWKWQQGDVRPTAEDIGDHGEEDVVGILE